jgi:predicted transposase YdaD
VTQDQQNRPLNQLPQVYDSSLKEWIFQQAPTILPLLLPGAIYEQTLTIELVRPTVRMDKVFKMMYHGAEHILHLEFQTGFDRQLVARLLVYNAGLYHDHHLPVITIVVYPFKVTVAVPPLSIKSGEDEILTFRFKTLALFELDAEDFVRQHHTAMYPLLPTMKNVHADLISQVMQELAELYRDDEVTLAQQFIWLQLLLERTDTISNLEKVQVKERLSMFDQLFEESPMIQRMREEYLVKGRQEGIQEGRQEELQRLQRLLINVVRARYPDLAELAQLQVDHCKKPDALELLIQQVVTAPNESTARWLLEAGTAM